MGDVTNASMRQMSLSHQRADRRIVVVRELSMVWRKDWRETSHEGLRRCGRGRTCDRKRDSGKELESF